MNKEQQPLTPSQLYWKRYYKKHKKEMKARSMAWYHSHREYLRGYYALYYRLKTKPVIQARKQAKIHHASINAGY